jgi:nicotine blue oxidoreductase
MIAAVVLAAGAATRFGAAKQQLLISDVLAAASAATLSEIVVVEGAHPLDLPPNAHVPTRVVTCEDWADGPGVSLRCGLETLSTEVRAAVVLLADGPDLSPACIDRVVEAWRTDGGELVAASYGGVRGHPLLVARSRWADVPDEGLRLEEPRLVPCDDLGPPGDVDRPEDLPDRFRQSS